MDIYTKAKKFLEEKIGDTTSYAYKHPIEVSTILLSMDSTDMNLVVAGVLHDVIEDNLATYDEVKNEFNEQIADLVTEVTKSGYNVFPNLKTQKGYLLKFADRLSNLSHMNNWDNEKIEKYMKKSKFWKGE